MLLTIWVILISLALVGLGGFTLARNTKSPINRSFAAFALVMAVWVVANFIGANFKTSHFSPFFIYMDLALGPWLSYAFWWFTYKLLLQVRRDHHALFTRASLALLAAVSSALVIAGGVIRLDQTQQGAVDLNYGPLYDVYSVALLLLAGIGVVNLIRAKRASRMLQRAQIVIVLWAGSMAAIFLLVANIVVPQITDTESVNLAAGNLSYLGLVFFIAFVAYAIIKHRLFDIRLIVARSVAYAMVLTVLVGLYVLASIAISEVLSIGDQVAISERVLYIFLAILAALVFPSLKKFFDRVTNHLFYRDAYDPQELLNELNKVLVSTMSLTRLSDAVTATLRTSLKAEYCTIILLNPRDAAVTHIVSAHDKKLAPAPAVDIKAIHAKAPLSDHHSAVIASDDLEYVEGGLKRILIKENIAVLCKIGHKTAGESNGLGYLLLGQKLSGNPYSSQDLRILEIIVNELVLTFQNALRFEEIENFNATLQQKVDKATHKLRRTNEKLRQLDETKDDFISMASHQLRTPLTSVKGYVSMVVDGDAGDLNPMQRKLLTQAFISSQRMVYLISDLLNVSRLRTGKFVIETVQANLANIVQEEVRQLIETAKGRNLDLVYHKPEHFPTLMLDETKIRQVIMNFIDNAIYYTPSGGSITVSLVERPQAVEFTVTDTGIGVPRAEQHRLFSKFYRAPNAKRARPDGTGLGLFMAKKVVVAQGGSIVFRSQEGKGSTFGFTFAKAPLMPEEKRA